MIMSSWPPTSRGAALHEDVADVDAVPRRGVLGVAQEGGVDPGVPEGEGLAVDPDRPVLQRADDVVGGVLQLEQVAAVLAARTVRRRR